MQGLTDLPWDLPVLYVLMRGDLASLNAGKACAQSAHASNQFIWEARQVRTDKRMVDALITAWENQSGFGFGVTLTLTASIGEIERALTTGRKMMHSSDGVLETVRCGRVHDSSYPLLDGATMHKIPLDTCAYVFGIKYLAEKAVLGLDLMR